MNATVTTINDTCLCWIHHGSRHICLTLPAKGNNITVDRIDALPGEPMDSFKRRVKLIVNALTG